MPQREPLSAERVVDAALAVADRDGIAGLSMRSVGRELGVEAMSLYHHVAGKDALVGAVVERVVGEIGRPALDVPWREAVARRCRDVRAVLRAHPWSLGLLESRRAPGPALLLHHEAMLECLRRGGFSVVDAAHAFSVLDAYVYGFALTEQHLPFEPGEGADAMVEEMALPRDAFPRLAEMVDELVAGRAYDYGDEFEWGLALVLDGLEARLAR
ncbi:TetR/AcrR family transcriptional regulator [Agrococcus terreus]|uniref:TetR family transcriptional regulator n=1 Tax=Agrococcus terreus TaxID=574649 RepID=A0ABQ2KGT7_9MICO|nr:TetR/AcrR family transcriptional regulator [Agrococcus terreus]GGN80624.1 TetR family transcriptional regulator [Agrococcus terreus]